MTPGTSRETVMYFTLMKKIKPLAYYSIHEQAILHTTRVWNIYHSNRLLKVYSNQNNTNNTLGR
jgi:hypothetical protein